VHAHLDPAAEVVRISDYDSGEVIHVSESWLGRLRRTAETAHVPADPVAPTAIWLVAACIFGFIAASLLLR
jgi:hypothetical protein